MKVLQIVGVDLSKNSIDLFDHDSGARLKIDNSASGFKGLVRWLKSLQRQKDDVFLVMEHTGLYSFHLEAFLHQQQIQFSKVPPLAIKRSLGLIRGKNDKIDAERIARFGFEKKDRLMAETPVDPALQRLQMLNSTRERLVKYEHSLTCAIKEYKQIIPSTDPIIESQISLAKEVKQRLKLIDEQIRDCIKKSDSSLLKNFKLLTGVKGIGPVIATTTLVKTKNFTAFKNARKFSCYCGSAPFDHTSGKTIRKKTRISHLADKTMKTLLTLGARTAIQHDKELKAFYQRRLAMGKLKSSTINIVRNKLISRMFAVIKRQTPFVPLQSNAAHTKFGHM